MSLVNVIGEMQQLDQVLFTLIRSRLFHPQQSSREQQAQSLGGGNTYTELLKKTEDAARLADFTLQITDTDCSLPEDKIRSYLEETLAAADRISTQRDKLNNALVENRHTSAYVRHLLSADIDLDELLQCRFVHVRVGRMPKEDVYKLSYYDNKNFVFVPLDNDGGRCWGFYFCSMYDHEETDSIFSSLGFKQIRIPDYVHGEPEEALRKLSQDAEELQKSLKAAGEEQAALIEDCKSNLNPIYTKLKTYEACERLKAYTVRRGDHFVLSGFILKRTEAQFQKLFEEIPKVHLDLLPAEAAAEEKIPVKLKNHLLSSPFEMFITMYGLPRYTDLDPTPVIALFYTLLFGIMFGDLGQGLLLAVGGFLVWRLKKSQLARIITRCGVSSMVFGTLYGSVFGYENLLDPFYQAAGLSGKPLEVMAPESTNFLLLGAIVIGAAIILTAMVLNIIVGIRRRDIGRCLFSNNGVAGLCLYGYAVTAIGLKMLFSVNILKLPFILGLVVLPTLLIFFQQPILNLMSGRKPFENGVGGFIAENLFELLDVFLSYVTNTMSFLRVGGFVLSHAGMMAVVMTLTKMVSAAASPVVVVLGNLFVIGMEGLIVGIQVLRLQFYEVFGRFYDGDGEAYAPIQITQ